MRIDMRVEGGMEGGEGGSIERMFFLRPYFDHLMGRFRKLFRRGEAHVLCKTKLTTQREHLPRQDSEEILFSSILRGKNTRTHTHEHTYVF